MVRKIAIPLHMSRSMRLYFAFPALISSPFPPTHLERLPPKHLCSTPGSKRHRSGTKPPLTHTLIVQWAFLSFIPSPPPPCHNILLPPFFSPFFFVPPCQFSGSLPAASRFPRVWVAAHVYLGVSMLPGRRNALEAVNGFVSSSHVVHFHWRSVPVLYNSFSNTVVHLERISARSLFFLGSTFVLCLWPLLLFCFYLDVTQLIFL